MNHWHVISRFCHERSHIQNLLNGDHCSALYAMDSFIWFTAVPHIQTKHRLIFITNDMKRSADRFWRWHTVSLLLQLLCTLHIFYIQVIIGGAFQGLRHDDSTISINYYCGRLPLLGGIAIGRVCWFVGLVFGSCVHSDRSLWFLVYRKVNVRFLADRIRSRLWHSMSSVVCRLSVCL